MSTFEEKLINEIGELLEMKPIKFKNNNIGARTIYGSNPNMVVTKPKSLVDLTKDAFQSSKIQKRKKAKETLIKKLQNVGISKETSEIYNPKLLKNISEILYQTRRMAQLVKDLGKITKHMNENVEKLNVKGGFTYKEYETNMDIDIVNVKSISIIFGELRKCQNQLLKLNTNNESIIDAVNQLEETLVELEELTTHSHDIGLDLKEYNRNINILYAKSEYLSRYIKKNYDSPSKEIPTVREEIENLPPYIKSFAFKSDEDHLTDFLTSVLEKCNTNTKEFKEMQSGLMKALTMDVSEIGVSMNVHVRQAEESKLINHTTSRWLYLCKTKENLRKELDNVSNGENLVKIYTSYMSDRAKELSELANKTKIAPNYSNWSVTLGHMSYFVDKLNELLIPNLYGETPKVLESFGTVDTTYLDEAYKTLVFNRRDYITANPVIKDEIDGSTIVTLPEDVSKGRTGNGYLFLREYHAICERYNAYFLVNEKNGRKLNDLCESIENLVKFHIPGKHDIRIKRLKDGEIEEKVLVIYSAGICAILNHVANMYGEDVLRKYYFETLEEEFSMKINRKRRELKKSGKLFTNEIDKFIFLIGEQLDDFEKEIPQRAPSALPTFFQLFVHLLNEIEHTKEPKHKIGYTEMLMECIMLYNKCELIATMYIEMKPLIKKYKEDYIRIKYGSVFLGPKLTARNAWGVLIENLGSPNSVIENFNHEVQIAGYKKWIDYYTQEVETKTKEFIELYMGVLNVGISSKKPMTNNRTTPENTDIFLRDKFNAYWNVFTKGEKNYIDINDLNETMKKIGFKNKLSADMNTEIVNIYENFKKSIEKTIVFREFYDEYNKTFKFFYEKHKYMVETRAPRTIMAFISFLSFMFVVSYFGYGSFISLSAKIFGRVNNTLSYIGSNFSTWFKVSESVTPTTNSSIPTPTNSSIPIPTPTNSSIPIPTNSSIPTPTNSSILIPTSTNSSIPIPTNSSIPQIDILQISTDGPTISNVSYYSVCQANSKINLELENDPRIEACKGLTNSINEECAKALEIESKAFGKDFGKLASFGRYFSLVLKKLYSTRINSPEELDEFINKIGKESVPSILSEAQKITTELANSAKDSGIVNREKLNDVISIVETYNKNFKDKTLEQMVDAINSHLKRFINIAFLNPTKEQAEHAVNHMIQMQSVQNSFDNILKEISTKTAEELVRSKLDETSNKVIKEALEELATTTDEELRRKTIANEEITQALSRVQNQIGKTLDKIVPELKKADLSENEQKIVEMVEKVEDNTIGAVKSGAKWLSAQWFFDRLSDFFDWLSEIPTRITNLMFFVRDMTFFLKNVLSDALEASLPRVKTAGVNALEASLPIVQTAGLNVLDTSARIVNIVRIVFITIITKIGDILKEILDSFNNPASILGNIDPITGIIGEISDAKVLEKVEMKIKEPKIIRDMYYIFPRLGAQIYKGNNEPIGYSNIGPLLVQFSITLIMKISEPLVAGISKSVENRFGQKVQNLKTTAAVFAHGIGAHYLMDKCSYLFGLTAQISTKIASCTNWLIGAMAKPRIFSFGIRLLRGAIQKYTNTSPMTVYTWTSIFSYAATLTSQSFEVPTVETIDAKNGHNNAMMINFLTISNYITALHEISNKNKPKYISKNELTKLTRDAIENQNVNKINIPPLKLKSGTLLNLNVMIVPKESTPNYQNSFNLDKTMTIDEHNEFFRIHSNDSTLAALIKSIDYLYEQYDRMKTEQDYDGELMTDKEFEKKRKDLMKQAEDRRRELRFQKKMIDNFNSNAVDYYIEDISKDFYIIVEAPEPYNSLLKIFNSNTSNNNNDDFKKKITHLVYTYVLEIVQEVKEEEFMKAGFIPSASTEQLPFGDQPFVKTIREFIRLRKIQKSQSANWLVKLDTYLAYVEEGVDLLETASQTLILNSTFGLFQNAISYFGAQIASVGILNFIGIASILGNGILITIIPAVIAAVLIINFPQPHMIGEYFNCMSKRVFAIGLAYNVFSTGYGTVRTLIGSHYGSRDTEFTKTAKELEIQKNAAILVQLGVANWSTWQTLTEEIIKSHKSFSSFVSN